MEDHMEIDGEEQKVLAVSLKDRLILMNPENGDTFLEKSYPEDIVGIEKYDSKRYLLGLADGRIYLVIVSDTTINYGVGDISSDTTSLIYCQGQDCVIQSVDTSRNIVFSRIVRDEHMISLALEKEIDTVEYISVSDNSGESRIYRCVFYHGSGYQTNTGLNVYETGSSELIYKYECQEENAWLYNLRAQNIGGKPCILFEKHGIEEPCLILADLSTGKTLIEQKDSLGDQWRAMKNCSFHSDDKAVIYNTDAFGITEVTEKGVQIPGDEQTITLEEYLQDVKITADDKYIIVALKNMGDEEYYLKVWNLAEGMWQCIEGEETISLPDNQFTVGQETSAIAVYTDKGTVDLFDLEEGACIQSLPVGYFNKIDFKYMNHDKYLVVCGDNQYLTLWDIESGEARMQDKDSLRNWGNAVYVDGNEHYFGLAFNGYMVSDDYYYTSQISLYYVDDEGRFYHYADVPYGCASFEAGEIFVESAGGYYSPFYGYQELKTRAEDLLDGETLNDDEKKQYFISD